MSREFRLPDLGEGLPEAELVQWLVAPGDDVALNQTIAEVETAKAIVDLPSPFAGTVTQLHAEAGEVVAVGSVLISFDVEGAPAPGNPAPIPAAASTSSARPEAAPGMGAAAAAVTGRPAQVPMPDADTEETDAAPVPHLVGYGAAARGAARPARRPRKAHMGAVRTDAPDALRGILHDAEREIAVESARGERPRSTPPVRRLAKDLGVDLATVAASDASGVISRADVEAHAARTAEAHTARTAEDAAPAARTTAAAPGAARAAESDAGRTTRVPIRGVRKLTADAMVKSAFTAPQATTFLTIDVTPTMELIAGLRDDRALAGHRIGLLAVVAKAVCLALPLHPSLASRWDGEADEIVTHHYVNLGIAAATDRGLVVPNVKDADVMTLTELADAIGVLVQRARAGRATVADLTGGVFSITNVGVFGIDTGTPILNPGEAGILAVGAVSRRPWEHAGTVALRDVMTLSLSFDHRLVDGEQAARFLVDVAAVLREPGRAMLLR